MPPPLRSVLSLAGLPSPGRRRLERRRCRRLVVRPADLSAAVDLDGAVIDVEVLDVSASGVRLLLPCAVRAGAVVNLTLSNPSCLHASAVPTRIVRCIALGGTSHAVGGAFVRPLSGDELRALLA